jgi:FtsP/CotA-like multicopper oxidase with cupredoxin domain
VNMLRKTLKALLFIIAILIVAGGGTFYVLAAGSKQPPSMNMGHMDHSATAQPAGRGKEVSVTSLVEKPSAAPVKTFELTAEERTIDTGAGRTVQAWTYNGTIPGPELRVRQGDRVVVHLKNRLSEGVTIHWHGVELPNSEDGVAGLTQDAVPPGGEFTYDFIATKPGTYWYHSHQFSDKQTSKGLYGTLIVEPAQNDSGIDKDFTAVLHNWENQIYTVNGTSAGERFDAKPGTRVRLRLVNTASDTHMMTLTGAPFQVAAIDGHDINKPTLLSAAILPIAASQRYDLVFTMPEGGAAVQLVNVDQTGFTGNFFTKLLGLQTPSSEAEHQMLTAAFGSGETKPDIAALLNGPVFDFTAYGSPTNDPTALSLDTKFDRQYDMQVGNALGFFNGGFTMRFTVDGHTFPDTPIYMVTEGDRVKIHIENKTDIPHPMHLHGHSFTVLSKNGKPLTGSPVYLSTVLVGKHESFDIAFVADNPGMWMLHCHNLGHAANGMDMMVNYTGVTTPYSVGTKSGNHPD